MPAVSTDQALVTPILADAANNQTAFTAFQAGVESRLVLRYLDEADRTARNPTPTAGQVSWVATPGRHDYYTGTAWWELRPLTARKTAEAQVANNSTAFLTDTHLVLPMAANAIYALTGMLWWDSGTTADMKLDWIGPAGFTVPTWGGPRVDGAAANYVGSMNSLTSTAAATVTVASGGGIGSFSGMWLNGVVVTAATAGNLNLRWSQNALEAVNTRMKTHSWIQLLRVG